MTSGSLQTRWSLVRSAYEGKVRQTKSAFRSIWRMWSLFSGLNRRFGPTFGVHNSHFSGGRIFKNAVRTFESRIEGTEIVCPQCSGGRFCQVVARTGSTVYREGNSKEEEGVEANALLLIFTQLIFFHNIVCWVASVLLLFSPFLFSSGTRLRNARKNVGEARYAFSQVQIPVLPRLYRPPDGTFGAGATWLRTIVFVLFHLSVMPNIVYIVNVDMYILKKGTFHAHNPILTGLHLYIFLSFKTGLAILSNCFIYFRTSFVHSKKIIYFIR